MSKVNYNGWVNDFGSVLTDKNNSKKFYIKIKKDVTLREGDVVHLNTIEENMNRLVKSGKITEEEAQERINKLNFIKYSLTLPPRD